MLIIYFLLYFLLNNNLFYINKIIILPNEYLLLDDIDKKKFDIYEKNHLSNPISYIKKDYLKIVGGYNNINSSEKNLGVKENHIMNKKIITPDEYYLLSDNDKSKYEINEYDYNKFPNRVVPKNYKKINL